MQNQLPVFYMGRAFTMNGLEKLYIYINSNVTIMSHSDVPKYLNYIILILAFPIEISMPRSNSDTFLQTVLETQTNLSSNPIHGYRF